MSLSDRIHQNKLSIYDLLVSRNKERYRKEIVHKRLSGSLSDTSSKIYGKIRSNSLVPMNVSNKIKDRCELLYSETSEECLMKCDLNVIMKDKPKTEFENKKEEAVFAKNPHLNEDVCNLPLQLDKTAKSSKAFLALITDYGTTQKYHFCKRPERLIPLSTLKPKHFQSMSCKQMRNLTGYVNYSDKVYSEIKEPNDDSNEMSEKNSEEKKNNLEIHVFDGQRARSKIRSVEEIISSLKSDDYIKSQLESDKRIDELIQRVLNRTEDEKRISDDDMEEMAINEDHNENKLKDADDQELQMELDSQNNENIEIELERDIGNQDISIEAKSVSESKVESIKIRDNAWTPKELEQLLFDLENDVNVTNEDLIAIQGSQILFKQLSPKVSHKKFYSGDMEICKTESHKGLHDLCVISHNTSHSAVLSQKHWVENYIPDKYQYHKTKTVNTKDNSSSTERVKKASERIVNQKEEIETWQKKAFEMLNDRAKIEVIGTYIFPSIPRINDIWEPMAPKLRMAPSRAKQILCPDYHKKLSKSNIEVISTANIFENFGTDNYQYSKEDSICSDADLDAMETKEKLLSRRTNSSENLCSGNYVGLIDCPKTVHRRKRLSSAPNRHWLEEDSLIINLEYYQIMEEINVQKQRIIKLRNESNEKRPEFVKDANEDDQDIPLPTEIEMEKEMPEEYNLGKHENINENIIPKNRLPSQAEKALMAGRNYIYYPPRKSKSKKRSSANIARITAIEEFLSRMPNKLLRTESFDNLKKFSRFCKTKSKNKRITTPLCKSLSHIKDFDDWSQSNGYNLKENARDWISVVWDSWFDEVYPPLPPDFDEITGTLQVQSATAEKIELPLNEVSSSLNNTNDVLDLPEKIEPVLEEVDKEFRDEVIETLHLEIKSLTAELGNFEKPNAFLLSRRGAIYRKLGFLIAALHDLNESISIEPDLLTAYWERHLLYLVCNKTQSAIDDLNYILKKDKNQTAAYKSRANIYLSIGDTYLAISNISQAIRLDPNDADAYAKRAELYEQNGDHRLALEDYNQLIRLQPDNSVAMMKHGLYYLSIEQWQLAIQDFSNVLRYNSLNTEALLHRGSAYVKLHQWQDALTDFSSVIHLYPQNYIAYFKRGCLLRKAEPYLAIRDFSLSLLLESSEENILAYLYRGILYAQTKQYTESIVDFEIVICFNKDMCFAHVNLGLVYFEIGDFNKAVKYMTSGLAADPTYIRAYVCRAEALFKMKQYEEAIKDVNRAIHFYPDRSNYYMLRGDIYLAMGNLEMAAICVGQAAEISHNLGQSPVQQALIHSFLKHYDQAIVALFVATKNNPSLELLNLLGTTQMKAQKWKDAITSFSICLEQLKPSSQYKQWPEQAAQIYFMVAQCYLELKNYKQSQQAFSAAIKINPHHSEAYYYQGWCRLRLGKYKQGILDLNKALAINPKFYQAYLARASLFGLKNQFTKAILNCNEVLLIEPRCLQAYLYRGALKYKIKAYSLAVKDFTEAIKIDPNCILAYFNRAICFISEKRNYRKAIRDYSIVLMINDILQLHYKAYINRGLVYLEMGDVQNALHDFMEAQSMSENNISVLYVIGLCHHRLKNLHDAVRIFSQCLEYDPKFISARISRGNVFMDYNSSKGQEFASKDYLSVLETYPNNLDSLINLGYCRQAQGKFKQAWDIFTEAIEKHPLSEKPLDGRAIICMQMRDLNGALKDLNMAIRIQPQSAVLYTNRGVVYQLMRDGIRAMKDYNKAILIGGYQCHITYYNIGCIYLHNFQLELAFECFSKTLDTDPADEAAWMNLALIYIFREKLEESIEYINKAISLAPFSAYLFFNRGNVFFDLKEYEKAEEDFSTCLKLVPDDPQVHKLRADCRNKLGNTADAIEDYKTSVYISSSCNQKQRL